MTEDALFDAAPYHVPVGAEEPGEKVSADSKRTARQLKMLANGQHPIARQRLHPLAAPYDPALSRRDNQRSAGIRCRHCRFHQLIGGHSRDYPKCFWPDPDKVNGPRISAGAATDCRGWFPACTDFEPPFPTTTSPPPPEGTTP